MAATAVRPDVLPRVLVVEDDHAICEIISDYLAPLGVSTVCVQSDQGAYDVIPTTPAFKAILLDVNLGPGTTGFDVARYARQKLPDVAVIYISGQASEPSFRAFGVPESTFVAKPFTADELVAAVRSRLPAND